MFNKPNFKRATYILLICATVLVTLNFSTISSYADKTQNITISDSVNPPGTKYYCYHRLYGQTYSVSDRRDLGTAKTYAWVLTSPIPLGTHYWVCRPYILEGTNLIEAADSNEISWISAPSPVTITGTVAAIYKKDVILNAKSTAPIKDVNVRYSIVGSNYVMSKLVSTSAGVNFTTQLSRLKNHTSYSYTWVGTDTATGGVVEFSSVFTTL